MANLDPAHQPFVVPGRRNPVLDAAHVLMLYGVVGAVATTLGSRSPPGDAARAMGGLVLWLLGVWLLAFVPAAGRFPRAALVEAAAANAALGHFFAVGN